MKASELWQFLEKEQQDQVEAEVKLICDEQRLPTSNKRLIARAESSKVAEKLKQIDPKSALVKDRLTKANQQAIVNVFQQLVEQILTMILKTVERLEQEKSIDYLGLDYSLLVNKLCRSKQFQWRIWTQPKGSLWDRVCEQIGKLFKGTLGFMIKTFQVKEFNKREHLEIAINKFQKKLDPLKSRLSTVYFLESSVMKSLVRFGEEERKNMGDKGEAYSQIFEKIEQIEQQKQVKEQVGKDEKKEKQKLQGDEKEEEDRSSILAKIKESGSFIVDKISSYFADDGDIPKTLEDFDDSKLSERRELDEKEIKFVEKLSYTSYEELKKLLNGQLDSQDIWHLEFLLRLPLLKWQETENLIVGPGKLVQDNRLKIYKWKSIMTDCIKSLEPGKRKQPGILLVLTGILYRSLEKQYSTLTKRYLVNVLEGMEVHFGPECPYLRGALQIFQSRNIKPSDLAIELESQLPYRSPSFEASDKSIISRQTLINQGFGTSKDKFKEDQHVRFQRLTYAKPGKNVTFLVSGYLSENSEKDLEWVGAIRSLADHEMYGVLWKSSNIKELLKYIGMIAGGIAISKAGGSLPLIAGVAQFGLKIAQGFMKKDNRDDNPFWMAITNAQQAGKQLADELIAHFSDRHITLIGFSMGTEVIKACVQHLIYRKSERMLLRIATFGGVADRQSVQKCMKDTKQPLSWINFQSNRDYAVRYMFRACTLGGKPIGWGGIRKVEGHDVENIEVEELVSGHMDYRRHLYGLTLLAGLNHE